MHDSVNENVDEYVRQLEAIVDATDDAVVVKDREGRYRFVDDVAAEYLGHARDELLGATAEELFDCEDTSEVRERERTVLQTERRLTFEEERPVDDDERVFEVVLAPYYGGDGDLAGTVAIYRDVTERKARERELEDQRDELQTLNRINEVVQAVIYGLIGEASRTEIEQAVCDRLVESDLYEVAWIGQPDPSGSEVTGVVGAGLNGTIRDIIDDMDVSEASEEPVPTAYYTGETLVVQSIPDDGSLHEHRRKELVEWGIRSGISVPIRYGDTTYGVLSVGSERLWAFSDHETDAFEVLGEVIGFAINAVKHRRLALSDTVAELEFRLTDPDSFYVAVSERFDCHIELEGMAAGPEGTLLFYDTVRGADPDAVLAATEEWDAVEDARVVSDHDDRTLFEFTVSGSSVVLTLSEYGADTTKAVCESGEARIVAQLPADADVREVVERVQTEFPAIDLVAKRECERDVRTAREFRRELDDRLTDAQRTALRASYFAGYYEWPRESTAEKIAESLGISSPTLHQHVRKAQRELLSAFFDTDDDDRT